MTTALHPALSRPVGMYLLSPSERVTREELDRADRVWRTLHHRGNQAAVYRTPYPSAVRMGSHALALLASNRSAGPPPAPSASSHRALVRSSHRGTTTPHHHSAPDADWSAETATLVGSIRSDSPTLRVDPRTLQRNGFVYVYPAQRAQMAADQLAEEEHDRMLDEAAGISADGMSSLPLHGSHQGTQGSHLRRSWSAGGLSGHHSDGSRRDPTHARRWRWKQALKRLWN